MTASNQSSTSASQSHYGVFGFGDTGQAVARYLLQKGCRVSVFDENISATPEHFRRQFPEVNFFFGTWSASDLLATDEIVLSPGVPMDAKLVVEARTLERPMMSELALFTSVADAPIIAVTGTNGKSTVVTLVGHLLRQCGFDAKVGGNLGPPAISLLSDTKPDYYVIEVSSYQLESSPDIQSAVAVVLNISSDHLSRHKTMQVYQELKEGLYTNSKRRVVNRAMQYLGDWADRKDTISFGLSAPQGEHDFGLKSSGGATYIVQGAQQLLDIEALPLIGMHNVENVMASLALVYQMGLLPTAALEALKGFHGLPHRCQFVRFDQQVTWINDSKATNVGAAVAALESIGKLFKKHVLLIMGGIAKDDDFDALIPLVERYVVNLLVIGQDSVEIARALGGAAPVTPAPDLTEAVYMAHYLASPGDCVLLSPGCASFDMFGSFQERGKVFMEAVELIAS